MTHPVSERGKGNPFSGKEDIVVCMCVSEYVCATVHLWFMHLVQTPLISNKQIGFHCASAGCMLLLFSACSCVSVSSLLALECDFSAVCNAY